MQIVTLPTYRVLIVEDDMSLRTGLHEYFELEGFEVTSACDGDECMKHLRERRPFDLVLLDNMLPKLTGFDVLRHTKQMQVRPPILMMTACGEKGDILNGFDLGVDDYIVKPFSVELLMARVKAILRRRMPPAQQPMDVHRLGEVEVNFSAHQARRGDEEIHFTVLEYELLQYLIQNEGRVIPREELLRQVWNVPAELETRTVDRHIASLRRKIEPDPGAPTFIRTMYGMGYQFRTQ